ncbi:MAG: recombination mediator RecR [Phycisphaerales bacterium]
MADRPLSKPTSTAYPEAVQRLIDRFAALPGIGRRSAERLAFHVLKSEAAVAKDLARALTDVKDHVKSCRVCFNLSDGDQCAVCRSDQRDRALVLVVEQPKDLLALELTGMYKGVYHVLMGRLSPLDGIGPGDLTVAALLERIDKPAKNCGGIHIREVILGLNPTLEGDGTGLYLAEQFKSRAVKVSRLARGLPTGSDLEHANKAVLADAIQGRQAM